MPDVNEELHPVDLERLTGRITASPVKPDAANAGLLNGYQHLGGASGAVLEWNFGDVVADSYVIHRAVGLRPAARRG